MLAHDLLQGKSSKFNPYAQKVSLNHVVADEDVVSSKPLQFGLLNVSNVLFSIHQVNATLLSRPTPEAFPCRCQRDVASLYDYEIA